MGVRAALAPHPLGGVVVPVVARIGQAAERCFDIVPAAFVVETALDQFADERTSAARTGTPVELFHQSVIQSYV